jgi:hypothetical protein
MSRASVDTGRRRPECCVVVGYDGSTPPTRSRAEPSDRHRGRVMLVPVEPSAHLDGIVAEPLLETADELSRLLADARGLVARTCTIDVRTVARDGNPAEELLRAARPPMPISSSPGGPARTSTARDSRLGGRSRRRARAMRRPRRLTNAAHQLLPPAFLRPGPPRCARAPPLRAPASRRGPRGRHVWRDRRRRRPRARPRTVRRSVSTGTC